MVVVLRHRSFHDEPASRHARVLLVQLAVPFAKLIIDTFA
jgi:hypothetical protein